MCEFWYILLGVVTIHVLPRWMIAHGGGGESYGKQKKTKDYRP